MDEDQKRKHFRLEYPKTDCPLIEIDGHKLQIIDISEHGCRFVPMTFSPNYNMMYTAIIKFADGTTCKVMGKIVRTEKSRLYCAMQLTQGIPLTKMMEEHRRILQKFKR
jgi:hypothetical protein